MFKFNRKPPPSDTAQIVLHLIDSPLISSITVTRTPRVLQTRYNFGGDNGYEDKIVEDVSITCTKHDQLAHAPSLALGRIGCDPWPTGPAIDDED